MWIFKLSDANAVLSKSIKTDRTLSSPSKSIQVHQNASNLSQSIKVQQNLSKSFKSFGIYRWVKRRVHLCFCVQFASDDFYCQLCLYVSLFLCLSVSMSLCLSVSLSLSISPKPNLTLNMAACWLACPPLSLFSDKKRFRSHEIFHLFLHECS